MRLYSGRATLPGIPGTALILDEVIPDETRRAASPTHRAGLGADLTTLAPSACHIPLTRDAPWFLFLKAPEGSSYHVTPAAFTGLTERTTRFTRMSRASVPYSLLASCLRKISVKVNPSVLGIHKQGKDRSCPGENQSQEAVLCTWRSWERAGLFSLRIYASYRSGFTPIKDYRSCYRRGEMMGRTN